MLGNNIAKIFTLNPERINNSVSGIMQSFNENLAYIQGRFFPIASKNDYYMALAYTVRDRLMNHWTKTAKTYFENASRTICYLSAEFLLGPQLGNNIINLGIENNTKKAIKKLRLGITFNELLEQEPEPGLGSGGLGRLAACYLDSMATLNIPAIGYGIRYEFGIFNQEIHDGWQVESTDKWLRFGNPWEIPRPEISYNIKFGGHLEHFTDNSGRFQIRWLPNRIVKSVAYDTPIIGFKANTANFLRLWKAEACESFDLQAFNTGDYYKAVHEKISSENITKVLYPNDEPLAGKKLRLEQQYFFVASSLQDMIRIFQQREKNLINFHEKYTVQLNDTHPAIAISELMRILVDEHQFEWETAWTVTQKTFCYTNHTILPEALEKWPLDLFGSILPRHLEIIFEINRRFINIIGALFPNDFAKLSRLSIIDETGERYIRMANLACIGSHAINGVSTLHTELLKTVVLKDFHDIWPEKFSNKTNGISPRRFLLLNNPRLTQLIQSKIGDEWIKNLEQLKLLEPYYNNQDFVTQWQQIKLANKIDLTNLIDKQLGIKIDATSLFDIHAKRIHEYKRQHLNLLHVITLYNRIRNLHLDIVPRTVIFAGKAAPNYFLAKLIIKLINSVAEVINNDPIVKHQLKVIFLPNYNVKNSQWIYPAADLSEQISTAGKEASGTGNMKFALNGAITIGTLDGANIEMCEEIGTENFFFFGLTSEQITALKQQGYNPNDYIQQNDELRQALDLINSGYFSSGDKELFKPLTDQLYSNDEYMVCADYQSYIETQELVSKAYANNLGWAKMSIYNTARVGKFSSDRAIREYCADIWNIRPVKISD